MSQMRSRSRSRVTGAGLVAAVDDFMSWLLYGYETWLMAVLKGVPLFLYVYFLMTYVPNYVYYGITQYLPFPKFTPQTGFIFVFAVGGANLVVLIVLLMWTQAARGRRGFAWSLVRILNFLQMLFVYLLLIPLLAFNMAGGTFVPPEGTPWYGEIVTVAGLPIPVPIAFGALVAVLGAAALLFFVTEYRRVTRRAVLPTEAESTAYLPG
jgi:hypothetical protein